MYLFLLYIYIRSTTDIKYNCESFAWNHLLQSHLHSEAKPLKKKMQIAFAKREVSGHRKCNRIQNISFYTCDFSAIKGKKKIPTLSIIFEA